MFDRAHARQVWSEWTAMPDLRNLLAEACVPREVMQGLCGGHADRLIRRAPILIAHFCSLQGLVGALQPQGSDGGTPPLHPRDDLLLPHLQTLPAFSLSPCN